MHHFLSSDHLFGKFVRISMLLVVPISLPFWLMLSCGKEERLSGLAPPPPTEKSWALSLGGAGVENATAMTLDPFGNLYLAVSYTQDMTLGNSTISAANGANVAIVKFDSLGTVVWSKSFGNSGNDSVSALATQADGSLVMTGKFSETITFGGDTLTSAGSADVFLAQLAPDGTHAWSHSFGGPSFDRGVSLALDGAGDVTLFGEFSGTMTVDNTELVSAGLTDLFIVRYLIQADTMTGAIRFGGTRGESALSMQVNSRDLKIAVGGYAGNFPFAGLQGASVDDSTDVFVVASTSPMAP